MYSFVNFKNYFTTKGTKETQKSVGIIVNNILSEI